MKILISISVLLLSLSGWAIAPEPNKLMTTNCGQNTYSPSPITEVCYGQLFVTHGTLVNVVYVLVTKMSDGSLKWYRHEGLDETPARSELHVYSQDAEDGVKVFTVGTVSTTGSGSNPPSVQVNGTTPDGDTFLAEIDIFPVPEIALGGAN